MYMYVYIHTCTHSRMGQDKPCYHSFVILCLAEELGTSSSITIPSGLVYAPINNADLNALCVHVCAQKITSYHGKLTWLAGVLSTASNCFYHVLPQIVGQAGKLC